MFVCRSLTNCMHIFNYLSGLKISRALAEIKRYLITLQVMLFFFSFHDSVVFQAEFRPKILLFLLRQG